MQSESKFLNDQQVPTTTSILVPKPWVKPLFQQVSLNDALAGTTGNWSDIADEFLLPMVS